MLFVIALILFGGLALMTVPFYVDLHRARKGEKTTFDGPEFILWKIFAFLAPASIIFFAIYVLFQ